MVENKKFSFWKACFSSLEILFMCDSSFSENTRQTKSYCTYLEGNANRSGKYYSGETPVYKNPDDNWSHDNYKPTILNKQYFIICT